MHKDHGPSDRGRQGSPPPPKRPPMAGQPLFIDPLIGQAVRGILKGDPPQEYRIKKPIAKGGMGGIYLAMKKDGTPVAVKFILDELRASNEKEAEEYENRFVREMTNMASVGHENVVRILDFGGHQGKPFYVMEYLEGTDLEQRLKESMKKDGKPLHWGEVAKVMVQALDGLHAAHQKGIIHRDMKTSNIFLLRNGMAKLIDFGLSRNRDTDLTLTAAGTLMGTVHYIAPEQLNGGGEDKGAHRADIYACGIIMYKLLCGVLPFTSTNQDVYEQRREILFQHKNVPPVPPRQAKPDVDIPVEIEGVILRAMEKKPDMRFQSAAEMRDALRMCLGQAQVKVNGVRQAGAGSMQPVAQAGPAGPLAGPGQQAEELQERVLLPPASRTDIRNEAEEAPPKEGKRIAVKAMLFAVLLGALGVAYHYRETMVEYWKRYFSPERPVQTVTYEKYEANIESDPPGASVFEEYVENGKKVETRLGETPIRMVLEGDHTFILRKDGHKDVRLNVSEESDLKLGLESE